MASWVKSWAVCIALLSILIYQLGVFDRPPFRDAPLPAMDLIVATCNDPNFGQHIPVLLNETLLFVQGLSRGDEWMQSLAQAYPGSIVDRSRRVSVGLYLDEPFANTKPRWAIGWAVQAESDSLQEEVMSVSSSSKTPELGPCRDKDNQLVHIPSGTYRQARIPWRNFLTPMIAPLLHWKRAFESLDNNEEVVAMEVYVTSQASPTEKEQHEFIDYVVVRGSETIGGITKAFVSMQ